MADTGISFKGLEAGSYVIVIPAGELGDTAYNNNRHLDLSSLGDSDWVEVYSADQTVDYNIYKLGYIPIQVRGVLVSDFVIPVYVQQVVDRAYNNLPNLTYGVDLLLDFNTSPWEVQVLTPATIQDIYSFLMQLWSAATSVTNFDFPIYTTGVNAFTTATAWVFSVGSFDFIYDDGLRYEQIGSFSSHYSAIKSIGNVTGMQARAQIIGGTNPAFTIGNAELQTVDGNVNKLVQTQGDLTHGNFDSSGYLYIKYQENGFYQAAVNVHDIYGDLEDQLYVVALEPKLIPNFTLGDAGVLDIVVTYNASPAPWNGGTHKIKIQDNVGYTGAQIQQYLNYQLSQQNSFATIPAFSWPDMVRDNGDKFKTERGDLLGVSNNCGVKVVTSDGVTPHNDFTLFTADDGSTHVNVSSPIITLAGFVSGSIVVINDLDAADPQEKGTELLRVNNATVDINYVGLAGNSVSITVYKSGYKRFFEKYTIAATDATLIINQELETN